MTYIRVFGWSSALGAVALGGKVYICGGFDGMSSLNSVEMYDPETDEWTMVSSMEKHRSASGVVVLDSQIYAIGGHDGLSIFDSVSFSLGVTYWRRRASGVKRAVFLPLESLDGSRKDKVQWMTFRVWRQCIKFSSVTLHCSLHDRKGIQPVKTWSSYPQRFHFWQLGQTRSIRACYGLYGSTRCCKSQ